MERTGRIIAIHSTGMDVQVQTPSACGHCGSKQSCHGSEESSLVSLPLSPGAKVGEEVNISIDAGTVNVSAVLAYLLPAITLIIGAWVGESMQKDSIASIVGALLGMVLGLCAIPVLLRVLVPGNKLTPNVEACPGAPISNPTRKPLL
jgi:sigma-E factor negative regulatory protein RseC